MALGSVAVSNATNCGGKPSTALYFLKLSFTGESSYPTNGSTGFAATVAAAAKTAGILAVQGIDKTNILAVLPLDCNGYTPAYDASGDKLKFYYGDNNNASDGPAIEVPNTTDLHTLTFTVTVIVA